MQLTSNAAQARPLGRLSRPVRILLGGEAATFAVAATVHFATGFTAAAVPETIIAVVLGTASLPFTSSRASGWKIAIAATCFATFGTIVGLTAIATGRQDVPDLAYHASILTALLASLVILMRPSRR